MADALTDFTAAIAAGTQTSDTQMLAAMRGLFGAGNLFAEKSTGARWGKGEERPSFVRNAYGSGSGSETQHVAYAGFIHPENPSSGTYGGTSLAWFPTPAGSLIAFVVGTRGLSPDEGILLRPGHRRRIFSLRRQLVRAGVTELWARADPANLGVKVPPDLRQLWQPWEEVFNRYGAELYCLARVPTDDSVQAEAIVRAFLSLYAYERGWKPLAKQEGELNGFIAELNAAWLASPSEEEIVELLHRRRFVVLQGPPGTGKSRLAEKILREHYAGHGQIVQFHPSTTYENFVAGIAPDISQSHLRFEARPGFLLQAAKLAQEGPALLVIDEINRADLGRVLGEGIYLLEATQGDEAAPPRRLRLPQAVGGQTDFELPTTLAIVATMNTADRSVAKFDLAIRRRFAFVTLMPDRQVVVEQSTATGLRLFDALAHVFIEYAPDEALALMPGHAYFIVPTSNEQALRQRLRYELLPLLDEYLHEGYLGPAGPSLHAVRQQVADAAESAS